MKKTKQKRNEGTFVQLLCVMDEELDGNLARRTVSIKSTHNSISFWFDRMPIVLKHIWTLIRT